MEPKQNLELILLTRQAAQALLVSVQATISYVLVKTAKAL